jgi:hypothetical protein
VRTEEELQITLRYSFPLDVSLTHVCAVRRHVSRKVQRAASMAAWCVELRKFVLVKIEA